MKGCCPYAPPKLPGKKSHQKLSKHLLNRNLTRSSSQTREKPSFQTATYDGNIITPQANAVNNNGGTVTQNFMASYHVESTNYNVNVVQHLQNSQFNSSLSPENTPQSYTNNPFISNSSQLMKSNRRPFIHFDDIISDFNTKSNVSLSNSDSSSFQNSVNSVNLSAKNSTCSCEKCNSIALSPNCNMKKNLNKHDVQLGVNKNEESSAVEKNDGNFFNMTENVDTIGVKRGGNFSMNDFEGISEGTNSPVLCCNDSFCQDCNRDGCGDDNMDGSNGNSGAGVNPMELINFLLEMTR